MDESTKESAGGSTAVRASQASPLHTVLAIWIALSLMWFAIDMLNGSESLWF
jgi:hypothetical protein